MAAFCADPLAEHDGFRAALLYKKRILGQTLRRVLIHIRLAH